MKRSWNGWLWSGFVLVLAGLFTYIPFFALFPVTRDFPWVNLLLLAIGLALLGAGLGCAFRPPPRYRGRGVGRATTLLAVPGGRLFPRGSLFTSRPPPAPAAAPPVRGEA